MAWYDHEELKTLAERSERYKKAFPEVYNMSKKNDMKVNHEEHFGFSFADDELSSYVEQVAELGKRQNDTAQKIGEVIDTVMPLLKLLLQKPEQDYINWPGKVRVQKIQELVDRLESLR